MQWNVIRSSIVYPIDQKNQCRLLKTILSKRSGSNIYRLITFLIVSLGCIAASGQGFIPAQAIDDSVDSVTFIVGADTLKLPRVYAVNHPPYTPALDTSKSNAAVIVKPQPANSGLDAVGSITRGIQVSSNSSVSLQSSMFLKIKGNLSENYTVEGVLTDKTSPLQPIGNTRRLNDFERVLIQIDGPDLNASIGDVDLKLNNGKFGKVDRSLEGINVQAKSQKGGLQGALGFSYGKNHLLQIQGKNGKQGPYRLSGKNGEKYIIVLGGSEKVKLDDHLLIRGEDDDYIIDYNAAEIYFTQNHILSANSRISVEFEYVPDIYLASYSFGKQLISGEVSLGNRANSPFYVSAAWQDIRDDKNNPLGNIEPDQLEQIFGPLGTNTNTTELSTVVLDTLNGSYDQDSTGILLYRGEQLGDYVVEFSFVGLDRGAYRKEINAIVPYYVYDPEFGEYLPANQYIAPQSLSVFALSGHAQKASLDANFDVGISQDNKNLYSNAEEQSSKIAWDVNMGVNRPRFELRWGDRQIQTGYASHDALESLEYYRKWHLSSRLDEAEHLSYGHLRIGQQKANYLKTSVSTMERSGTNVGQQIQIESSSDQKAPLFAEYIAILSNIDSSLSQTHAFKSSYRRGRVTTGMTINLEDGSSSVLHASNDHLESGINTTFEYSENQEVMISYIQRRDYRFPEPDRSILNSDDIEKWSDHRQDWIADYRFENILDSKGLLSMKYREHRSDSGAVKLYYLGKLKVSGQALDKHLNFQENFLLDEEHIPKFDYHYIEVDTGYGDFSFDPAIQDYIPMSGGRFIRQRLYSDREEQVRKFENESKLEYTSDGFGNLDRVAFRSRLGHEYRLKQELQSQRDIQSQSMLSLGLDMQTGQAMNITRFSYSGKSNQNSSTLYNYGAEENEYTSHSLDGDFIWNSTHQSKIGVVFESRKRALEYNPLAREEWVSTRPFLNHITKVSAQQKLEMDVTYSLVNDKQLDKMYSESLLNLNHSLRIKRRGRIDQKMTLSTVVADVQSIPYSVFSGRQPGDNWKYSVNGRYTFSSMFQVSMNYSIQKRGDNQNEQYLRLEGRTHF